MRLANGRKEWGRGSLAEGKGEGVARRRKERATTRPVDSGKREGDNAGTS